MTNPIRILTGDCRETLKTIPDGTVQCCVTSPPYWGLRDYGVAGQLGQEPTPDAYVETMVEVFREVRRVLHDSGTVWLNVGDSFWSDTLSRKTPVEAMWGNRPASDLSKGREALPQNNLRGGLGKRPEGIKPKDLCLIPWRLAIALQADGWWLRSVICWAKKSCMPESVTDRPTNSWEPIFLLTKSAKYFYDAEAVKEPSETNDPRRPYTSQGAKDLDGRENWKSGERRDGNDFSTRNQRNVWHLGPEPYAEAHFATFPTEIPRRAILAGTSARGCCPKCYAPWVRVVEKPDMMKVDPSNIDRFGTGEAGVHRKVGQAYQDWRDANPNRTVGWEPGCECGEQPIPQTALDPFGGSGTTGQVALELARHAILCELNPEYAKLIERRTDVTPGFALH